MLLLVETLLYISLVFVLEMQAMNVYVQINMRLRMLSRLIFGCALGEFML